MIRELQRMQVDVDITRTREVSASRESKDACEDGIDLSTSISNDNRMLFGQIRPRIRGRWEGRKGISKWNDVDEGKGRSRKRAKRCLALPC
jgi:hypothetical protein